MARSSPQQQPSPLSQQQVLARHGYAVVAYDWFGCGRSPKPQGWDLYAMGELYEDLKAMRYARAQALALGSVVWFTGARNWVRQQSIGLIIWSWS